MPDTQNLPRLRGENPPQSIVDHANLLAARARAFQTSDGISIAGGILVLLIAVWFHFYVAPASIAPNIVTILVAGAAIALYYLQREQRDKLKKEMAVPATEVALDAFNTEFTSPLADHSTLRITVHFQIPSNLTHTVSPSSYQVIPSSLVQNLNRTTEAKLTVYTQPFAEPPSREDLEDFLNRALVQFQEENKISVMRVNVPLAIHVRPEKPRTLHVSI